MQFTMTVHMNNSAFDDNPSELSDILGKIGDKALNGTLYRGVPDSGSVLGTNGAVVGSWRIKSK